MPRINARKAAQNTFLIIGLVALGIMIYKLGLTTIIENIQKTGWWFIPVIGIWGVVYVLNTISSLLIIRDGSPESKNVKFPTLYKIILSSFAINSATPVGLAGGEPYKIMELKPYLGTTKATSSVILFSMMHVVSHFLFWILSILLAATAISLKEGWGGALIAVLLICFFLIYIFYKGYRKGLVMNVLRVSSKIPFLKKTIRKFIQKEEKNIQTIDIQIASLHGENKVKFYLSLAIELFARVLSCAEIYFIFIALDHPVTYINCILIMGFTSLFANILFFSPMQIGTREGGFLLIFGILGLPSVWAVSISFITRIRELFWMMIGIFLMKINLKDGSKIIEKTPEQSSLSTPKTEQK